MIGSSLLWLVLFPALADVVQPYIYTRLLPYGAYIDSSVFVPEREDALLGAGCPFVALMPPNATSNPPSARASPLKGPENALLVNRVMVKVTIASNRDAPGLASRKVRDWMGYFGKTV
jgi:hypothetical protein